MDYPLARHVYAYVIGPQAPKLDGRLAAFLAFVLSPEGQKIAVEQGFLALQPDVIAAEKTRLE